MRRIKVTRSEGTAIIYNSYGIRMNEREVDRFASDLISRYFSERKTASVPKLYSQIPLPLIEPNGSARNYLSEGRAE